jgi:hypothetical protein
LGSSTAGVISALVLLVLSGRAGTDEPLPTAATLSGDATPAAPDVPDPAAEAAIDEATHKLITGDRVGARTLLVQVKNTSSEARWRNKAARMLADMDASPPPRPPRAPTPAPPAGDSDENLDGRTRLIVASTGYGTTVWGIGVPLALDADGTGAIGSYLLVSGASFAAPLIATSDTKIPMGSAVLAQAFGAAGWLHGASLYMTVAGKWGDDQGLFVVVTGLSIGEFIGTARYGFLTRISAGDAEILGTGALFGGGIAAAFAATPLLLNEGDDGAGIRVLGGSFLAGSLVGVIAADRYADARHLTWGDSSFIGTSMLMGPSVASWSVTGSAFSAIRRAMAPGPPPSSARGRRCDRLGHDLDMTTGDGMIIDLSVTAGGAFGLGLMFLGGADSGTAYLTSALVGASVGYAASYSIVASRAAQPVAAWFDRKLNGVSLPVPMPWLGRDGSAGIAWSGTFLSVYCTQNPTPPDTALPSGPRIGEHLPAHTGSPPSVAHFCRHTPDPPASRHSAQT